MDPRVSLPVGLFLLVLMGTWVSGQEQPVYLTTHDNWAFYKVRARGQMLNPTVRETCHAAGMDHPCRMSGAAGCTRWWTSDCITYVGTGDRPCTTHSVLSSILCGTWDSRHCQPLDDMFVYTLGWSYYSYDSAYGIDYDTHTWSLTGARFTDMYALCAVATCAASPCAYGTCTGGDEGYNCTCESGWTGQNCDQDVDECVDGTANCDTEAACTNTVGGFNCTCNTGYGGDGVTCTDHCDPNPCQNGGVCNNTGDSYTCECAEGWGGTNCETDVDECAGNTDDCDTDATCTNTDGSFTCTCNAGYNGDGNTCTDVDECAGNTDDCDTHATCTNTVGGFNCTCNAGYSGDGNTCTDDNECTDGTANCVTHATCTNTDGSFTCTCDAGYSGDGNTCTDDNECTDGTANCDTDATCTNTPGSFTCTCDAGHSGDGNTCTDDNECTDGTANCDTDATCTNTDGSFTCTCNAGYSGDGVTCTDEDECTDDTANCDTHATCSNTPGSFTCTCNAGYNGDGITCAADTLDLSGLTFPGVGMDKMTLSWTVSADVTRYRLRYRHAGASYQDLSPPPAPGDTQATVRGLWADTEYTFTLTAYSGDDVEIGGISGTETTAEVIVTVDCEQDKMAVTFPRAVLTGVDVENMHLFDDNCGATYTDTKVTFETGLEECGTIQESSDEKLIFTNEAIGSHVEYDNGAVRKTPFRKRFHCEFVRQYVVSEDKNFLFNIPQPRVQVVNGEQEFTTDMHMFTSADFAETYKSADYPVQVTPADQLHFGLSLDSPLDNLELFALHCLATPSDDPEASPSVSIIQNGCPIDETLQLNTELSGDMASYYSIESFTFPNVEDPSLVYIHCILVVCFKDDPDSRCSQGCIPDTRRRRAVSDMSEARVRRASETDETVTISQGPFKVVRGEKQATAVPTVGIAVGTAAGIAGVLLMVAAVFLVRKRRRRDVKEQAEDCVGFDNYSFELWGKDKAANATPKPE